MSCTAPTGLETLEQSRRAHTAADAHGDDDIFGTAALALDERMASEPRARHPVRMADRDGAAVHVDQLVRNAELVLAIKHLDRERLVQLPQPDVVDGEPETFHELGHREYRPDPHLIRLGPRDRHADVATERFEPALLREVAAHHDRDRCAVAELACI